MEISQALKLWITLKHHGRQLQRRHNPPQREETYPGPENPGALPYLEEHGSCRP